MATGFPTKANYAAGDILTAANMNDLSGTLNSVQYPIYNAAGKNVILNGDFYINQRNFTSVTTHGSYSFDRWCQFHYVNSGTVTTTPQTFTPGAAPVTGYEGKTYAQIVTASQSASGDYVIFAQLIENVRTFAGQNVTVSFWAKAASGTPKIAIALEQNFGTGGSPSAVVDTNAGTVTLSTSWARYSITVAVPSLTGKTIGTTANTSSLGLFLVLSGGAGAPSYVQGIGNQNNTFSIWGVQVEAGSTASGFQTATGTIQGELAACQRYYQRFNADGAYAPYAMAECSTTTVAYAILPFLVEMRTTPTLGSSSASTFALGTGGSNVALTAISGPGASKKATTITCTVASGLTVGRAARLTDFSGSINGSYLDLSAEL